MLDVILDSGFGAIVRADSNGLTEIVRTGQATPLSGTYQNFSTNTSFGLGDGRVGPDIDINDAGSITFAAELADADATGAAFFWSSGSVSPVAFIGQPRPGGGTIDAINNNQLTERDEVLFMHGSDALYLWDNGALTTVVSVGDQLPGGGQLSLICTYDFASSESTVQIGVNVRTSQQPVLRGIYLVGAAGLEKVVESGDALPGGDVYDGVFCFSPFAVSLTGRVAFTNYPKL